MNHSGGAKKIKHFCIILPLRRLSGVMYGAGDQPGFMSSDLHNDIFMAGFFFLSPSPSLEPCPSPSPSLSLPLLLPAVATYYLSLLSIFLPDFSLALFSLSFSLVSLSFSLFFPPIASLTLPSLPPWWTGLNIYVSEELFLLTLLDWQAFQIGYN